jgi:DNA-binding GntR family transcriptional regulator
LISHEKAVENLREGLAEAAQHNNSKKKSLAHEVYSILLAMLMNKELPPGTVLNRREIAKQFGVSVAPVLEAVIQLELEGFFVTIPRKGTIVAPFGHREIYDHLMVREALECQAARMYCGKPIRDNYDTLLVKAAMLDSTLVNGQANWNLEYDFHESLVKLSESKMLIKEFSRIIRLGTFYSMFHIYSTPGKELVLKNHHELLAQLSQDNPDIAERAVRDHLLTTNVMLIQECKTSGLSVPGMGFR